MRIPRIRALPMFFIALLAGAALLHISQMVQNAEDRLMQLQAKTDKERDSIRVLKAEWAYLNSPQRLEVLSTEYLGLVAPSAGQMVVQPPALKEFREIPQPQLYQEISLQDAQAEMPDSVIRAPAPGRKPAIATQSFSDLIDQGGAP